jgi:type I restriction enzyme S subunit
MTSLGSVGDLFGAGPATDPLFIHLCDPVHERDSEARSFAERLWVLYIQYADPHFLTEIRHHFHARFWEMYLTCALLEKAMEHGYSVSCPKPGPDVLLELNGGRIWIEAVAATNGEPGKPDTLIEPDPDGSGRIPEEKIVLRYTTAIRDKYKKYFFYLRKGVVHKNDAYVVAVNKSGLAYRLASAAIDLPRFLKALYPIGELEVLIDRETRKFAGTRNRPRFFIPKASQSPVPVQAFVDRRWRGLSAVLCSDVDVFRSSLPLGSDMQLAYNPLCRRPIARGVIPAAREWWSELKGNDGELFCDPARS